MTSVNIYNSVFNKIIKKNMEISESERLKFFNHNKLIAIDPGINGGIVIYSIDDKKVIEVIKMPSTPSDLLNFLKLYQFHSITYLEKVQGRPKMGGVAMFTFGKGVGHLEMALMALKIPTIEVTPQKWMKALQLGTKGTKTNTQWKNKLKKKAQMIYPYIKKITLATSDALLILEYARLTEKL